MESCDHRGEAGSECCCLGIFGHQLADPADIAAELASDLVDYRTCRQHREATLADAAAQLLAEALLGALGTGKDEDRTAGIAAIFTQAFENGVRDLVEASDDEGSVSITLTVVASQGTD